MDLPPFDELRELAQRDPEGFESLRQELIEDCICSSSARNRRRLRGLQFVVEAKRRVAATPMKALLDIQEMMFDSLLELQKALQEQGRFCEPPVSIGTCVLDFRPPLSSAD